MPDRGSSDGVHAVTCEHCLCAENEFDDRHAEHEVRDYLDRGPHRTTAILLDWLTKHDLAGSSLLDIGGGVGTIAIELLEVGVEWAILVEASNASLRAARSLAEREGVAGRVEARYGDFLDLEALLEPAEIVTLDRVICCYPYGSELVRHSARHATRWYGVVVPRRRWFIRIGIWLINAFLWIRGSAFRTYLHDPNMIDAILDSEGFALDFSYQGPFWRTALYRKASQPAGAR